MQTFLCENGWKACVCIEVNLGYSRPSPLDARNLESSLNPQGTCAIFQAQIYKVSLLYLGAHYVNNIDHLLR